MPPPPGNKALLRDYENPLVSLNKALLGPYWGGSIGGVPLGSHDDGYWDVLLVLSKWIISYISSWLVLSDEQMSKKMQFSLLNDEQRVATGWWLSTCQVGRLRPLNWLYRHLLTS